MLDIICETLFYTLIILFFILTIYRAFRLNVFSGIIYLLFLLIIFSKL